MNLFASRAPVTFAHGDKVPLFSPTRNVKRRLLLPLCCASAALCGCLGNSGDPSSPPTGVQPVIGDSIAGVTWNSQAGETYYVFGSTNPGLTSLNWTDVNIAGFPLNNLGSKARPPARP